MSANIPPYDQPPYMGSPYAQQPPPPPLPGSSSRWGPTSIGIDPAIAAGLAYLFGGHFAGLVPLILLIIEQRNRFVRFNAVQALLLIAAFFVGLVACAVLFVVGLFLAIAHLDAGHLVEILSVVLAVFFVLALLALDIVGIIAGFSGKYVEFPLIGPLAARLVGGRPVPLFQ